MIFKMLLFIKFDVLRGKVIFLSDSTGNRSSHSDEPIGWWESSISSIDGPLPEYKVLCRNEDFSTNILEDEGGKKKIAISIIYFGKKFIHFDDE